jgi:hypothetical protein
MCAIAVSASRGAAQRPPDVSSPAPWFEDVADRAGVRFVHHSGHRDKFYLPEIIGGGAALFDMDNDGDLDLYLVQSGNLFTPGDKREGNRLYRNRGDGTFDDVTAGSGADVAGYGMGVAAGDFDNDGIADLVMIDRQLPGVQVLAGTKDGLARALAIPVFEAGPGGEPENEPRELATGDLDGDGRCDFVLLAHDRILIYLQEK